MRRVLRFERKQTIDVPIIDDNLTEQEIKHIIEMHLMFDHDDVFDWDNEEVYDEDYSPMEGSFEIISYEDKK